MSTETVPGAGQVTTEPVDTSMPEEMGIDEALDFIQGEHDDTKDYDGVATDGDDKDQDDPDNDTDDETADDDDEEEVSEKEESTDESESDEDEHDDDKGGEFKELDAETVVFVLDDDGEEIPITAEEAKLGYMRNKKFTQGSQELSKERQELTDTKTSLLQTQGQYVEALALAKAAQSEELKDFIGVDWVALQKDDPIEYEEKEKEFKAATMAYQQTVITHEAEQEKLQLAAMEYYQVVQREEMGKLAVFLPEVAEKDNTLLQDIRGFAVKEYGFTQEELLNTYDNRMIRVLLDAYKGKAQAEKLVKGHKKAKGVKTTKAKASRSSTMTKARKAKATKAVLNREGGISIDEALGIIS